MRLLSRGAIPHTRQAIEIRVFCPNGGFETARSGVNNTVRQRQLVCNADLGRGQGFGGLSLVCSLGSCRSALELHLRGFTLLLDAPQTRSGRVSLVQSGTSVKDVYGWRAQTFTEGAATQNHAVAVR